MLPLHEGRQSCFTVAVLLISRQKPARTVNAQKLSGHYHLGLTVPWTLESLTIELTPTTIPCINQHVVAKSNLAVCVLVWACYSCHSISSSTSCCHSWAGIVHALLRALADHCHDKGALAVLLVYTVQCSCRGMHLCQRVMRKL